MFVPVQSLAHDAIHVLQQSFLPSLTAQQKRIIAIALFVFACAAACYALFRCCDFKAMIQDDDMPLPDPLVKEVDQIPDTAQDYLELGKSLKLGGKAKFPDGSELTQEQLFLKVLELEPQFAAAYNCLGTIIDAKSKIKLPDGKELSQQELFLKAIELDENDSSAYCHLGATLEGGGSMDLPDGTQLTREQQFVRVIEKHQTVAHPSLTEIMVPGWPVPMTRKELFLKAIALDEKNSTAYYNLRFTLRRPDERVTLPNGDTVVAMELLLETVNLNPQHAEAYSDIANLVPLNSPPFGLFNMTFMTKEELYLKAIELDPTDASAYSNLSDIVGYDHTVVLPSGEELNPRELVLKAIDIDPYYYGYYSYLYNQLEPNEEIELFNGTLMDAKKLQDNVDECANKYGIDMSPY